MFKKISLSAVCAFAAIACCQVETASAQFAPAPSGQQGAPQPWRQSGLPDDLRLSLMIRNTIIALNQANLTGNYSVLRDMGTPNFQITNSSARLGEVFSTLRARKLDLSPIMFFNPKLIAPPSIQDGQVLRLAGFFPTTPEQVNFDLAFQLFGEQWMLAGIAVNTAPASEGAQASASPAGQPVRTASDTPPPSPAKPGEAKPIRIDLSQPAPSPVQPPAKKPAAAVKKPKPHVQQTAAAQPATPAAQPPEQPAPAPAPSETPAPEEKPAQPPSTGTSWNPFGR